MAKIKPRRGSTTPTLGTLTQNELAVDTTNKRIYIGAADGSGTLIGAAPGGSDTQIQFNDSGNLNGDSGLTYNKTTDSLTITGDLAVNGGDITTSTTTATVFNTTATTVSIGGVATTFNLGKDSLAAQTIYVGSGVTGSTLNLFNGSLTGFFLNTKVANSLTFTASSTDFSITSIATGGYMNFGSTENVTVIGDWEVGGSGTRIEVNDSATSVAITAATTSLTGDLAVNGGDITTTATGTATVFNTNATTLNIGGAATALQFGATTGTSTFRNGIVAPAGTTTLAPFKMTSGTNLTTPSAGAFEYDGKCFYATTANGRCLIPSEHFAMIASTRTISNVNTAQNVFDSANDAITLASNTAYMFEGFYRIISGTTTHTTNMSFSEASVGTFGSWYWLAVNHGAAAGSVSRAQDTVVFTSAAGGATNSTSVSALTTIWFRGVVETTTDGVSVTPQITFSAAPGGTNQIGVGSFIRFTPIGTDTAQSVGPWA